MRLSPDRALRSLRPAATSAARPRRGRERRRPAGARLGLLLAGALFATGCPRQPDAPDPGMGEACETLEACNPGVSCGVLRLCVEGFCEEEASLIRACPDRGEPLPTDG